MTITAFTMKDIEKMCPSSKHYEHEYHPVIRPRHYTEGRKYEPIDVVDDWKLDFYLGNALKYIARAGHKDNELEDLKKATWYLDRKIRKMKEHE